MLSFFQYQRIVRNGIVVLQRNIISRRVDIGMAIFKAARLIIAY